MNSENNTSPPPLSPLRCPLVSPLPRSSKAIPSNVLKEQVTSRAVVAPPSSASPRWATPIAPTATVGATVSPVSHDNNPIKSSDCTYSRQDNRSSRGPRSRSPPRGPAGYGRSSQHDYRQDREWVDFRGQTLDYDDYVQPTGPPPNHGEKDEASEGNILPFLALIRGMKQSTTEQLFANGVEKLYSGMDDEQGGATPGSLKRVLLIRDRKTDQSQGYGFAEFWDSKDARAAVEKAKVKEGFDHLTISSTKVNVCFPHSGVFPTDDADNRPEYNDKHKFIMSTTGKYHKYYDRRYYASIYDVNLESPHKPAKASPVKPASNSDKAPPRKKQRVEGTLDSSTAAAKGPTTGGLAIFSTWNNKKAELRGDAETTDKTGPVQPATGVNAIVPASTTTDGPTGSPQSDEQTFLINKGDLVCCLLCERQWPQESVAKRHIIESKLHAQNLADAKAVEKGYANLKARGIDPGSTIRHPKAGAAAENASTSQQYRDRAAERRQQQGSEAAPKVGFSLKKKATGGTESSRPSSSSSNDAEKKPNFGKGFNMLQKHGWTEGQGLGSGGTGMAAPIEQSVFASGVGLGHEESKKGDAVEMAEQATREGGESYQDAVKRSMRERYQQM